MIRRTNRQGYKAGAMSDALKAVAHLDYKYVAVFDADFKPPADFLLEMVAPLEARPDLGFTQAKWLNPYHNFLTWVQVRWRGRREAHGVGASIVLMDARGGMALRLLSMWVGFDRQQRGLRGGARFLVAAGSRTPAGTNKCAPALALRALSPRLSRSISVRLRRVS